MRTLLTFLLLCFVLSLPAQKRYKTESGISYVSSSEADAYRRERCKLDIYYPEGEKGFPTIVWFHGGGLTEGDKFIPDELKEQGVAVVTVNYRLSPKAPAPAYIEDAAQAVAWTFENIGKYGGSKAAVVVSGHSAGAYLALMLALDKSYLLKQGVDADEVLAWFPLSGQTITHTAVRAERGLPTDIPLIDHMAPCNHARKDTPPLFLVTGDRHLELKVRYEENALLATTLKGLGNEKTHLYELQGFDHGTMLAPGCLLIVNYLKSLR